MSPPDLSTPEMHSNCYTHTCRQRCKDDHGQWTPALPLRLPTIDTANVGASIDQARFSWMRDQARDISASNDGDGTVYIITGSRVETGLVVGAFLRRKDISERSGHRHEKEHGECRCKVFLFLERTGERGEGVG